VVPWRGSTLLFSCWSLEPGAWSLRIHPCRPLGFGQHERYGVLSYIGASAVGGGGRGARAGRMRDEQRRRRRRSGGDTDDGEPCEEQGAGRQARASEVRRDHRSASVGGG